MSRRPAPKVSLHNLQDRSDRRTKNPHVVRWTVNGRAFSRSFPTKSAAESYLSRLRIALEDAKRFDVHSGVPEEWHNIGVTVTQWAREWMAGEWGTLAPRSRKSKVEALERALPVLVSPRAPKVPEAIRNDLRKALRPGGELPKWIDRWSLSLADLDRAACERTFRALGINLDGTNAAASTASRYRKTVRAMLDAAVTAEHMTSNPWPDLKRGHAQRKAAKKAQPQQPIDVRALPTPDEACRTIAALRTRQPRSADYQVTAWLVVEQIRSLSRESTPNQDWIPSIKQAQELEQVDRNLRAVVREASEEMRRDPDNSL